MINNREQALNHVLELIDHTFLDDRLEQQPAIYAVAVTTVCNLRCGLCIRETLGVRENRHMDLDAFARRVPPLSHARRVSLFGTGEPFLHPRFFEFLDLCRRQGVFVSTSTNGTSLTAEVRERIVESGLDELNLSLDAATPGLFARLRGGARLGRVIADVEALGALMRRRGSKRPAINVNMTIHARNLGQVPAMVRLASRLGCRSVSYSSAVIYRPRDEALNVLDTPGLERQLDRARRLGRRLGVEVGFWRQKAHGNRPGVYHPGAAYGCIQLNSTLIIERGGKVKPCCYLEYYVGDAWADGPAEAFNNEPMRRLRRDLMEGRVRPECQGCVFLRERTPFWMQEALNQAARLTEESPWLTGEDRVRLRALIRQRQQLKDALHPGHALSLMPAPSS